MFPPLEPTRENEHTWILRREGEITEYKERRDSTCKMVISGRDPEVEPHYDFRLEINTDDKHASVMRDIITELFGYEVIVCVYKGEIADHD